MAKRYYSKEFKEEAVKLVLRGEKRSGKIAQDLGINEQMLSKWKRDYEKEGKEAFPGKGHLKKEEEVIRKLERELYHVKMERDILKKAVAIFSKQP